MQFNYEKLRVTDVILAFISDIYSISQSFPTEEMYGLQSQIRRASTSILLNVAEGKAQSSSKQCARFLSISIGSLIEVDACLKIATKLGFVSSALYKSKKAEIGSIFISLQSLKTHVINKENPK